MQKLIELKRMTNPTGKYKLYPLVDLPNRTWPNKRITQAPIWCSVDLRDGNQSLAQSMEVGEKLEMFKLLVLMGFKEIEIGFPSATDVEFDFTRYIIDKNLIPDDVTIQVLTPAITENIKKTFSAIKGANNVIIHLYNSTSTLQREVVFKKSKTEMTTMAVNAAKIIKHEAMKYPGNIRYEYSPESFTGTELNYAIEICEAVMNVWEPSITDKMIINLPASVEMSTPNVYADRIEWFTDHLENRDTVLISIHAHNDRGCAVAATELALLAGGERVEGTLFGNGERTGNVDLITVALNIFTQGINPNLNIFDIDYVIDVYARCTKMSVPPRCPYAGELVYTAFSGTHQDAINKGMDTMQSSHSKVWEVPYLPIDPRDVGRTYEAIIRINSQSGKGGIAYIMKTKFGYTLPKKMQYGFRRVIKEKTVVAKKELLAEEILTVFKDEYFPKDGHYQCLKFHVDNRQSNQSNEVSAVNITTTLQIAKQVYHLQAPGNGPLDAFCNALRTVVWDIFTLRDYTEHALATESSSKAVSYIEILNNAEDSWWGVGVDTDITIASIRALLSALNRMHKSVSTPHRPI